MEPVDDWASRPRPRWIRPAVGILLLAIGVTAVSQARAQEELSCSAFVHDDSPAMQLGRVIGLGEGFIAAATYAFDEATEVMDTSAVTKASMNEILKESGDWVSSVKRMATVDRVFYLPAQLNALFAAIGTRSPEVVRLRLVRLCGQPSYADSTVGGTFLQLLRHFATEGQ